MKGGACCRRILVALAVTCAVSACHTAHLKDRPAAAASEPITPAAQMTPPAKADDESPQPTSEATKAEPPPDIPACSCADIPPKPAPKHKPKPVVQVPPAPPAAAPAPTVAGQAGVKIIEGATASILGKKVRGQDGDDLGRVVDILADRQGRVRFAVIEFGGFLGVGNRRIAVDWSLLKFQPGDADAPMILDVSKRKLEGTPEYTGAERPLALMAPAAAGLPTAAPK